MTLSAILFLLASVIISVLIIYLSYLTINSLLAHRHNIEPGKNTAYAILCSAMLYAVGTLLAESITPIRTAVQLAQAQGASLFEGVIKYALFFILLSFLLGMLINILSLRLFDFLTRNINEMEEIKNNNHAVAILTGVMILIIVSIAREGFVGVLESLLPYGEVVRVN